MPASPTTAVDKALALIEAVATTGRPLRLSEVAERVGLHRATAYRVLADLVGRGWILRVGDHYLPGPALLRLSRATAAATTSLTGIARPVLEDLAAVTGMMANLQVATTGGSRVVDVVRPARLAMISDLRDELLAAHRFAGPLALVAAMDAEARAPYLRAAEDDDYRLQGPDGLLAALDHAASDGFALQRGSNQPLVGSLSRVVTTTAGGGPVCALTLVGPIAEFDDAALPTLRIQLTVATDRLGGELLALTARQDER
ncbi:IclR family acetate operon transcriptional repressor [Catenulispora sp. GAS73]|uniref:IclR family transcriptional regulator n=1 Tax=Catenulispora sp. GAS73 TaxID=3156269 RepID=UPI003518F1CD